VETAGAELLKLDKEGRIELGADLSLNIEITKSPGAS